MNFLDNRLLIIILAVLGAYWTVGWYLPGLILSTTMAVFAVLAGLAIIIRYFQGVYGVLIRGDRSATEDGAHLAAVGIPAIAAAIVYGGLYTLAWNIAGQPDSWLNTPASGFSRLLLVGGCVALYLTPDVQRRRLSLPSVIWLILIMASAVLTAFMLGAYVGTDQLNDRLRVRPTDYPLCPEERPVWVAGNSEYFHMEDSPWRARVIPRRCFTSPEEALQAGYHPLPS